MKKQKIKKFIKRNFYIILFSFFIIGTVFGSFTSFLITSQYSTNTGSNNSVISFTGTVTKEGYYVNDESNSSIIQDYFEGYYFDSLFGYFKLDWSINELENVRFIDSTSKCTTGYGYKLGGKAFSEQAGYINFNYNATTFVYYCLDDSKLHGTAYGEYIGYQDFEGIELAVVNNVTDLTETVNDNLFINDTTNIRESVLFSTDGIESLGGDVNQLDVNKESIFYIIK
ncbi:MAG: hypothetical protein QM490_01965 [Candidatus Gracilibacteria bacterium]